MNLSRNLGVDITLHVRKLIEEIGIQGHFVDEHKVASYLGYEIKITQIPHVDGIVVPESRLILISGDISPERQRWTAFHEIGHIILQHNSNLTKIDDATSNQQDKEADIFAAEIMFPREYFTEDSWNLPISFKSIRDLADRYNASFEATCKRYADVSQYPVAILFIGGKVVSNSLQIQYYSRSPSFWGKHTAPGTPIGEGNIIFECWSCKQNIRGEIPGSVLGQSGQIVYSAECLYWGNRVFCLLSLMTQGRIHFA